MDDNKKTIFSSAASRYMHLIGGDVQSDAKNAGNLAPVTPIDYLPQNINNDTQVAKKSDYRPTYNLLNSFRSVLDSTDIFIEESDRCYKVDTSEISFLNPHRSQNESLFSIGTSHADEFSGGESSGSSNFLCPATKRFRRNGPHSFFNPSFVEANDSFFIPPKAINSTKDLFETSINDKRQSIHFMDTYTDLFKHVPKIQFNLSSSTSNYSESDHFLTNNDITMRDQSSNFDDASTSKIFSSVSGVTNKTLDETTNINRGGKKKVNTFYQVPYILNTDKIDEYYKNHKFDGWASISSGNIQDLMEPDFDYVAYRLKCLKPLTTGKKEEIIGDDNEDLFNCNSINETIEQIEGSFENGEFVCSTPEEKEASAPNSGTNPLNVGFLNTPSEIVNSFNVDQQEALNNDPDKTKSFIVNNKEQEIVWSAFTHVSSSIPVDGAQNDEPFFDITTIFEFNNNELPANDETQEQDKFFDDDYSRYELLLSIMNDGNPFDKTPLEMHETLKIVQNRKAAIMAQIEMMIQALVTSLVNHESMILKLHKIKDWKDCKYESNVLSQKETAIKIKSLSFTNKNTERTFTIVVHLLGEIYKLLGQNMTCTKRELYYRDVELLKTQVSVNRAIDDICGLFNVQCWEMGILSTSKGLIAGDLKITTDEDEIIDCSTTNSVPQKPSGIKSLESNAEYVLVVEKDTVFTRLIEDNIMDKIGRKIILLTAKGYPDINTRVLLKKIEMELELPIYIIVDADAFGIDIMCTYKYGSLQMVKFSEQLAISKMEWIGIHPTDIEKLDITRTELTDADLKKVDELIERPYMNKHLEKELKHLKERGLKAEIESIYHYSIDYLIHDYIPQKIASISHPMEDIIQESANFGENLLIP